MEPNEINSFDNDQLLVQESIESSESYQSEEDQLDYQRPGKICLFFNEIIKKIRMFFLRIFYRRNEDYLFGVDFFPGHNIYLFYLSLFFAFAAIVNLISDSKEPFWVYTLFFFVFFISSLVN